MPSNQFQSYRRVLKGEALWTNIYEFGRKLSSIFFSDCATAKTRLGTLGLFATQSGDIKFSLFLWEEVLCPL